MGREIQYLQIEPTTRCNFTCEFCAGRYMPQLDIDYSDFCYLIDSVDNLKHIELQGEGEPLIHPRFFDMLAYIHRKHPEAKISFITNGSLLTKSNVGKILQSGVNRISISIESPNSQEFQSIRGGKLEKVIKGIQCLMEEKSKFKGPAPSIGLTVTVLNSTVDQINAIGKLYRNLNLDGGLMIQPLQNMNCYKQFYSEEMLAEIPGRESMKKLQNLISSDKPLLSSLRPKNGEKGFYQDLFTSVTEVEKTCPWLENGLYIAASGKAFSCCFIKDTRNNEHASVNMSTVDEAMMFREQLLLNLKAGVVPKQCRDCGVAKRMVRAA